MCDRQLLTKEEIGPLPSDFFQDTRPNPTIQYKIVINGEISLAKMVTDMLNDKWELHGAPFLFNIDKELMAQALIRKIYRKPEPTPIPGGGQS